MLKAEDPKETSVPAADAETNHDPTAEQCGEPAQEAPQEPEAPQKTELDAAIAARDQAIQEKQDLFEKLQRAQAEFENARKRQQREAEEIREYAAMGVIESLLPIADDFERAFSAPNLDSDLRKGLELIYERMFDVFRRAGLRPVEVTGSFDPHLHHAVDRAPAENDEDDQKILEVYQQGYHFKDRLLRPAMVKVAVKE